MRPPQHIYSKGMLGLGPVREDAPNSQETGGPREWRGLVGGGGWPSSWRQRVRRKYGMGTSQRVDWEGNKIRSVKKKKD